MKIKGTTKTTTTIQKHTHSHTQTHKHHNYAWFALIVSILEQVNAF